MELAASNKLKNKQTTKQKKQLNVVFHNCSEIFIYKIYLLFNSFLNVIEHFLICTVAKFVKSLLNKTPWLRLSCNKEYYSNLQKCFLF